MLLGKSFGARMVIGNEEKGRAIETGIGKCQVDRHHIAVPDALPILLDRYYIFVRLIG